MIASHHMENVKFSFNHAPSHHSAPKGQKIINYFLSITCDEV